MRLGLQPRNEPPTLHNRNRNGCDQTRYTIIFGVSAFRRFGVSAFRRVGVLTC